MVTPSVEFLYIGNAFLRVCVRVPDGGQDNRTNVLLYKSDIHLLHVAKHVFMQFDSLLANT